MAESLNGVMFQYFHWYLPPDGQALWEQLRDEADNLRAIGVDAVWIPPPQKCDSGGYSVGYDVFDYFDLGAYDQRGTVATKYGTKKQLHEAINALHGYVADGAGLTPIPGARYIQVYVDIVLNQMFGGEVDPDWWQAIRVNPDNRTEELGSGTRRATASNRNFSGAPDTSTASTAPIPSCRTGRPSKIILRTNTSTGFSTTSWVTSRRTSSSRPGCR